MLLLKSNGSGNVSSFSFLYRFLRKGKWEIILQNRLPSFPPFFFSFFFYFHFFFRSVSFSSQRIFIQKKRKVQGHREAVRDRPGYPQYIFFSRILFQTKKKKLMICVYRADKMMIFLFPVICIPAVRQSSTATSLATPFLFNTMASSKQDQVIKSREISRNQFPAGFFPPFFFFFYFLFFFFYPL